MNSRRLLKDFKMIKLFLLLQRGRLQKKKSLYKQVWNMTFDPMLLFYVLALFTYIALLWLINMLMTSIEWRVFQLHFIWKSFIFITVIGVNIMSFMTEATIVGAVAFISLIVLNLFLLPRTTKKIAWEKVTAACDYQVWNMPLMTYFTKQKMKKERAYTIWQRVPF